MCHQFVPVYEACRHRYDAAAELSRCPENCAVPKEDLVIQQTTQMCPDCEGDHIPDYSTGEYFKCCSFSRICDHEYDHFVSELDREGHEDIVLVTPTLDTCPDCTKSMEKSGHKLPADMKERESQLQEYRREASRLPTFRMPSKMPPDFEDLERKNTADVKSVSQLPRTSFLPPSAAPRDTYNPSVLRVPASGRPSIHPSMQKSVRSSVRPSVAPGHSTRPESGSRYPPASVAGSIKPVTAIRGSQPSVRHSVAPSVRQSTCPETSVRPSVRPSGSSVRSQAPEPPLTAAELLKRGPPRNVAASAFYQNPDGDEARANIIPESRNPSVLTKMRTEYGGHTAAPRGSEASLDLEKLMGEHSITQSTIPESSRRPERESASRAPSASQRSSRRPNPERTSGGHSVMPPRDSRAPGASSVPRQSQIPSSSQAPGASRAPSASIQTQGNAKTPLPPYKTMAGEESKWPTNAPPTYKTRPGASRAPAGGAHQDGAGGGRGQSTIPEEEDIYDY